MVFGMLRAAWEASRLREVPAAVAGTPPAPFVRRVAAPEKKW